MQSCIFDPTLSHRNIQSKHRHTFDSAKCLHRMYLRREKQCLLAFKAFHSHPLNFFCFVFGIGTDLDIHPRIFSVVDFSMLAIYAFFPSHHFGVFNAGSSLCSDPQTCTPGRQLMVQMRNVWSSLKYVDLTF